MGLHRSPLEVRVKKRPRQDTPISPRGPVGAGAPPHSVPLPAESSFIPLVKDSEYEDVLTHGQPTCLGKGAFGKVLLKRKKRGGALVAFKSLLGHLVDDRMELYKEMLVELRALMAVQHHREFPRVLGIVDQTTYAVEFIGDAVTRCSRHLKAAVKDPPASLTELGWIQICLDVSRGLLALHQAGWSHNDLHSRNVMVYRHPKPHDTWGAKIIDLGKATRIDNPPPPRQYDAKRKTYIYRHCQHLAPELVEGTCRMGVKTDIFGLGYVFGVVSNNKPELGAVDVIHRQCSQAPKDRPTLESIIVDIKRFRTKMAREILRVRGSGGGALAC